MVKNTAWIMLAVALAWPAAAAESPAPREDVAPVLKTFVPKEDWFLPTGTRLKTTTSNAIFSYNLQTPVVAILDEDTKCPKNGKVILPKGTQLIGVADVLKTDDRVNIRFNLAVLPGPSGAEYYINGLGLWPDGSAGMKGDVKIHEGAKLMSSAASSALLNVGQVVASNAAGGIATTAAGSALQSGANVIESAPSMQNKVDISITVPPYQKCLVFLMNRLVLDQDENKRVDPSRKKSDFDGVEYKK